MIDRDAQELFDDSAAFRDLLRLAPTQLDVPEEAVARTEAFLRHRWHHEVRRSRRRAALGRALAIAATLAIAWGATYLYRSGGAEGPKRGSAAGGPVVATLEIATGTVHGTAADDSLRVLEVGATVSAGTELHTGRGDRAGLRLATGAHLRLDSGTRLRLEDAHIVELEYGTVYFDSGLDSEKIAAVKSGDRDIRIHTDFGIVRDVGTQFEARQGRASLRLRVREGSVRVAETHRADAGEELILARKGKPRRRQIASYGPEWDWVLEVAPALDLDEQPLGTFLRWLERETGWQVNLAEGLEEVPEPLLYGSTAGLRPDQAPELVLPTCGLKARLEGGILHVEPQEPTDVDGV